MFLDKDIEQPAAFFVPMSPEMRFLYDVIAFLYKLYEEMEDWEKDEVDALKLMVRREYMILMMTSLYCECILGGRAIFMDHAAMQKLERICGHVYFKFKHTAVLVLRFMKDIRLRDKS